MFSMNGTIFFSEMADRKRARIKSPDRSSSKRISNSDKLTDEELMQLLMDSDYEDVDVESASASSDDDVTYRDAPSSSTSDDEENQNEASFNNIISPSTSGFNPSSTSADGDPQTSATSSNSTTPPLVTGNTSITWDAVRPATTPIPFQGNPGLQQVPNGTDPIDFFFLLFNDQLFDLIIEETNIQSDILSAKSESPRARIKGFKHIARDDFEVFLGLLFHMGNIQAPSLQHFWKKDNLYFFPIFKNAMPRDKFANIFRCLHFQRNPQTGSCPPTDPLYKIRPLLENFQKSMKNLYIPNKQLSLDESMLLWRGRLFFRQYIKNKKHKYGVKFYMLTEPNGLVLRILIYCGMKDPVVGGQGHTEKVVKYLLHDYLNLGHSVYFDNFYSSVPLVQELLENSTYATGTLRAGRKGNPVEVTGKKLQKGEAVSRYTRDAICVVKWHDKRDVLMISSEFSGECVTYVAKSGKETTKPNAVIEYNKFMSGVDRADQLLSYYPCERKTLRWYAKVGVHIFHIILNNSYFFYKEKSGKNISLLNFRNSVISSLIYRHRPPLVDAPKPPTYNVHLPATSTKTDGRKKRKRCRVCTSLGIRKDVLSYCPICPGNPGLCNGDCFKKFHNYQ
jgi:hypothetical protein